MLLLNRSTLSVESRSENEVCRADMTYVSLSLSPDVCDGCRICTSIAQNLVAALVTAQAALVTAQAALEAAAREDGLRLHLQRLEAAALEDGLHLQHLLR